MNSSFYTGVSGLLAYQEHMNVIGNNMANVGTVGYQPVRAVFSDLLYTKMNVHKDGLLTGHGVKAEGRDLLITQGNPNQTNRSLDFALMGTGCFFAVQRDGQREFTRNGDFSISVEGGEGFLVTTDGAYVLDGEGERINLEQTEDGESFDTTDVKDRLGVYFFPNPYGLAPETRSTFLQTETSGAPISAIEGGYESSYQVLQNTLEQSAVNLNDEMTNLIVAQRAYQFSAKMVQTSDEIEEVLNNLR